MSPVHPTFAYHPVTTMTGDGKEISDIPSFVGPAPEFRTTYRFRPSEKELSILNAGGDIMVTFLTYGAPAPPIMVWPMNGNRPHADKEVAKYLDAAAHTNFQEKPEV